jgi:hypothetical protein
MGSPTFASINPMDNPNIAEYLGNQRRVEGRSMKALRIERESLLASLKATGQAQPATILWFNPVAGSLDGGIGLKLRSINDPHVLEDDQVTYKYRGRTYKAVVVPIKEPTIFSLIKDVKVEGDREYGVYEPRACKQIEIAYHFLASYTTGTPNSSSMGGILAFQGDRRNLPNSSKRFTIKVPRRIPLPNGWSEYETVERDFEEAMAETLDLQKAYSNASTQQAQSFWDQEDQRGNITTAHRIWHQFEMDMGWRQTAAPWVTLINESLETCVGCGETKKRVDAFFCFKCQRVYNPLAAYMAREINITHPSMDRVEDKDWPLIHKEEARRKALREGPAEKAKKPTDL